MPVLDLRSSDDPRNIDELAVFKTVAVMCYPHDLIRREKMLGTIRKETRVGKLRRSPFDSEEFGNAWKLGSLRGAQTGSLLLTMIQLRCHGYEPSFRLAIKLQRDTLLSPWTDEKARAWRPGSHFSHFPRHREIIMRNAREYGSVAHLWAAHLHSEQAVKNPLPEDLPSWPDSFDGFFRLVGYATIFWQFEVRARAPSGTSQSFFGAIDPWEPLIPEHMVVHPAIQALPIPDEWIPTLTTYRKQTR
jgi:hypothetical protein